MLLRDVMNHAVKVHKETTAPIARKESHARAITLGTVMALLLAFSAYSWVARPAFIWGPRPAPPPAVEQEAGMRFTMFLLSQRIKSFRESQGVLPSSLASIGEGVPGVTYAIVSDTAFELRAAVAGKRLVLRSDQPPDEFLGNSGNVIQGIGRP